MSWQKAMSHGDQEAGRDEDRKGLETRHTLATYSLQPGPTSWPLSSPNALNDGSINGFITD
jgi:hypothetical protein